MFSAVLLFFLVCIGIQCIYFVLFIIGLGKSKTTSVDTPEPVSVIIAARNELKNLQDLLPKLYEQDHTEYEIIVVNDQSTDDTYDYLKSASASQPKLKVVTVESNPDHINSKKFALTLGIKAAKHDLVLLTDADCVPSSEKWIHHMAAAAGNKTFVIGFSDYFKKSSFLNYFIRFETILTAIQYLSFARLGRPYMGVGRNLAYRKSFFLGNKGFNGFMKVTGGDDDLLVNKYATSANTAVVIDKHAQTLSHPKDRWSDYKRQKLRHLSAGKLYKMKDQIILAIFSLSYILSWLLLPVVLLTSNELYLVISSFLLRTLILHLTFIYSTKKLNVSFNVWGMLVLDLAYTAYYCYMGLVAIFTKRITWN